jgi:alginate O-acetyltransferase complex protein AlgI
MLFNSLQFLVFFPVVTILYFLLPHRFRWIHLLIASCIFYMAFVPVYILILLFTIVIDYFAGIMIENAAGRTRKLYLTCSIVANVGILAFFKYYNFLAGNINDLLAWVHPGAASVPLLNILLPIGLSFHTFQAMSYTIEVYRGRQAPERHFGIYALYVMFYPQLVAGPIERPQNLIHQFHEKKEANYDQITSGLKLMVWGMIKKVAIADRLALLTDPVFNDPHKYPAITLTIAAVFFAFQIYCDFSGYSDIAIGAARVMGFKLMRNFNRPYAAKSVSEFWSRWHISLSTWFRDYLYIPLGGNRVPVPRWLLNLFIVFLVSGLWHGAKWTFVFWGALHGTYLILAILYARFKKRYLGQDTPARESAAWNAVHICLTFLLVLAGWIFFRAESVKDGLYILKSIPLAYQDLIRIVHTHQVAFLNIWSFREYGTFMGLITAFGLITGLMLTEWLHERFDLWALINRRPLAVRWAAYYAMLLVIYSFGVFDKHSFIYFQF